MPTGGSWDTGKQKPKPNSPIGKKVGDLTTPSPRKSKATNATPAQAEKWRTAKAVAIRAIRSGKSPHAW